MPPKPARPQQAADHASDDDQAAAALAAPAAASLADNGTQNNDNDDDVRSNGPRAQKLPGVGMLDAIHNDRDMSYYNRDWNAVKKIVKEHFEATAPAGTTLDAAIDAAFRTEDESYVEWEARLMNEYRVDPELACHVARGRPKQPAAATGQQQQQQQQQQRQQQQQQRQQQKPKSAKDALLGHGSEARPGANVYGVGITMQNDSKPVAGAPMVQGMPEAVLKTFCARHENLGVDKAEILEVPPAGFTADKVYDRAIYAARMTHSFQDAEAAVHDPASFLAFAMQRSPKMWLVTCPGQPSWIFFAGLREERYPGQAAQRIAVARCEEKKTGKVFKSKVVVHPGARWMVAQCQRRQIPQIFEAGTAIISRRLSFEKNQQDAQSEYVEALGVLKPGAEAQVGGLAPLDAVIHGVSNKARSASAVIGSNAEGRYMSFQQKVSFASELAKIVKGHALIRGGRVRLWAGVPWTEALRKQVAELQSKNHRGWGIDRLFLDEPIAGTTDVHETASAATVQQAAAKVDKELAFVGGLSGRGSVMMRKADWEGLAAELDVKVVSHNPAVCVFLAKSAAKRSEVLEYECAEVGRNEIRFGDVSMLLARTG